MNAAEVIRGAAAAGIRISIQGDGLSLEAATPAPPWVVELIAQHKPEIIDLLRSDTEARVSWLDLAVAVENEAGRHRIWHDELCRRADDDQLTAVDRHTLHRGIADRARNAVIFDRLLRLLERARVEMDGDGIWDD